jgi:hypothetical protein
VCLDDPDGFGLGTLCCITGPHSFLQVSRDYSHPSFVQFRERQRTD